MIKLFKDSHIIKDALAGKTVAIIGYGNQGRPQAMNLRDSGVKVVIGGRLTSHKEHAAQKDEFTVMDTSKAVKEAEVIMLLLPDEAMNKVYIESIDPFITPESYMGFSHGMAIHAGWINPKKDLNVFLLAPKAQGRGVRNFYVAGSGVPALVAVHQDPSGDTLDVALSYGKAIGCGRAGILKATFTEETVSDLFSEQVVLCGGLTELIKNAFEVLVEAGYPKEVAYFECLYEVKLVADLIQEGGINFMRSRISSTARYGDLSQGHNVIDGHVKESMRQILKKIQTGEWVREFEKESASGYPLTKAGMLKDFYHPIEETGRFLRHEGILP